MSPKGRPAKDPEKKQSESVAVRFTPEEIPEMDWLVRQAEIAGGHAPLSLSLGGYIRSLMLKHAGWNGVGWSPKPETFTGNKTLPGFLALDPTAVPECENGTRGCNGLGAAHKCMNPSTQRYNCTLGMPGCLVEGIHFSCKVPQTVKQDVFSVKDRPFASAVRQWRAGSNTNTKKGDGGVQDELLQRADAAVKQAQKEMTPSEDEIEDRATEIMGKREGVAGVPVVTDSQVLTALGKFLAWKTNDLLDRQVTQFSAGESGAYHHVQHWLDNRIAEWGDDLDASFNETRPSKVTDSQVLKTVYDFVSYRAGRLDAIVKPTPGSKVEAQCLRWIKALIENRPASWPILEETVGHPCNNGTPECILMGIHSECDIGHMAPIIDPEACANGNAWCVYEGTRVNHVCRKDGYTGMCPRGTLDCQGMGTTHSCQAGSVNLQGGFDVNIGSSVTRMVEETRVCNKHTQGCVGSGDHDCRKVNYPVCQHESVGCSGIGPDHTCSYTYLCVNGTLGCQFGQQKHVRGQQAKHACSSMLDPHGSGCTCDHCGWAREPKASSSDFRGVTCCHGTQHCHGEGGKHECVIRRCAKGTLGCATALPEDHAECWVQPAKKYSVGKKSGPKKAEKWVGEGRGKKRTACAQGTIHCPGEAEGHNCYLALAGSRCVAGTLGCGFLGRSPHECPSCEHGTPGCKGKGEKHAC